jgi:hypothetical protein
MGFKMVFVSNNYLEDWEMKASRILVGLFGPSEAAKQLGITKGAMQWRCVKHGWKKAERVPNGEKDVAEIIMRAVEKSRQLSTVQLAKYVERASMDAAESERPLEVARKVADVSKVYSTLWPHEREGKLIEGAILVGMAEVKDAKVVEGEVVDEPIRERLSDRGQAGH